MFDGKVIIVTGASSGIGAEIARHLAKLGGRLALVGRSAYRLSEVADEIENADCPSPLVILADVTKDAQRIIDETIAHFGQLDVLINNAGIGIFKSIMNTDFDEYDHMMDTNLRSVFILTKLAVSHLIQTGGNILNISSISRLNSITIHPIYSVTKSALDQFTECCAVEFAPNVRVNGVNLGIIETPTFKNAGLDEEHIHKIMEMAKKSPVGRIGTVGDVATAVAFLTSESASFITGTLLKLDGGLSSAGLH